MSALAILRQLRSGWGEDTSLAVADSLRHSQQIKARPRRLRSRPLRVIRTKWNNAPKRDAASQEKARSAERAFTHCSAYAFSADSIAEINSGESGVTAGSKRAIGCPLRAMRNLVKFHLISPPTLGAAVRYW